MLPKVLYFSSRQGMLNMWNLNRCNFWRACTQLLHVAQAGNDRINLYIALLVKTGIMCFIMHSQIFLETFQSSLRRFNLPMTFIIFYILYYCSIIKSYFEHVLSTCYYINISFLYIKYQYGSFYEFIINF